MQELKKAGVVATKGYYRGPPQIIKLDVECTGEPKVKISPVLSKETVFYRGKHHVQFNSMYVCTLKVAGERHGITAQAQRGEIVDFCPRKPEQCVHRPWRRRWRRGKRGTRATGEGGGE